jgi:hypothetical protein
LALSKRPVMFPAMDDDLKLARVFYEYLHDYIGGSEGRPGPSQAICPFVRPALSAGVLAYSEERLEPESSPAQLAGLLADYLAWFRTEMTEDRSSCLVLAFSKWSEQGLRTLVGAHAAVRERAFAADCTAAVFHRDPERPEDERKPWPRFFESPAPFYVLRWIVGGDLQLAMRVPGMFPAYYRRFAQHARETRMTTSAARERWARECKHNGLLP